MTVNNIQHQHQKDIKIQIKLAFLYGVKSQTKKVHLQTKMKDIKLERLIFIMAVHSRIWEPQLQKPDLRDRRGV